MLFVVEECHCPPMFILTVAPYILYPVISDVTVPPTYTANAELAAIIKRIVNIINFDAMPEILDLFIFIFLLYWSFVYLLYYAHLRASVSAYSIAIVALLILLHL